MDRFLSELATKRVARSRVFVDCRKLLRGRVKRPLALERQETLEQLRVACSSFKLRIVDGIAIELDERGVVFQAVARFQSTASKRSDCRYSGAAKVASSKTLWPLASNYALLGPDRISDRASVVVRDFPDLNASPPLDRMTTAPNTSPNTAIR